MFVEYDPVAMVFRCRFGPDTFTDWRGVRSLPSLMDWRAHLEPHGFTIGRKTASRSWEIVAVPEES